ncbi:MAG: glycoside hydrolase family 88 protein [Filimonas sp.]|nr:glycoside hydrolase family 88 protein [Filimonas sp.]
MVRKFLLPVVCLASTTFVNAQKLDFGDIFKDAEKQTQVLIKNTDEARKENDKLVSPRTLENGKLKLVASKDWTSGFFPGVLWYIYEFNKKGQWLADAQRFTALIEKEKTNGTTHDMGFKVYCSFGNGYRLTKDTGYKSVLIQSAQTLATRFSPVVGCIRSWDHHADQWKFPVIIDNMMNLELLFEASKLSGDSSYYKIAVSHANTTMKNHFRADYSCYHVVDYDPETGKVVHKQTHQGFSDESAWARGQAWALYGYTMCYRETGDPAYLAHAEKVAAYILNNPNMPKDLVPYWDFNAPNIPNEPRDASAAAVIASGLYELSQYSKGSAKYYKETADKIINSLTKSYRADKGTYQGFILTQSTGSKPANSEVDVPLNYADYYYLEALLRAKKIKEGKKLF